MSIDTGGVSGVGAAGAPGGTPDVGAVSGLAGGGIMLPALPLAPMFYDVAALLAEWLAAALGVRVVSELPNELQDQLPLVCVSVIGGSDVNPAIEQVTVDVDCYVGAAADGEPDPAAASDLAERVRTAVVYVLRGYTTADGKATVCSASTVARPAPRPYDDTTLRRYGGTYQLIVHSRG